MANDASGSSMTTGAVKTNGIIDFVETESFYVHIKEDVKCHRVLIVSSKRLYIDIFMRHVILLDSIFKSLSILHCQLH